MTYQLHLFGHPVAQTISPLLHNYWAKKYDIDAHYAALDIAPDDFATQLKKYAADSHWRGANITLPYKERAALLVDEMDDAALAAGAINTIVRRHNGQLFGTNTDGDGLVMALQGAGIVLPASRVFILGAGGAARGIINALLRASVLHITLCNRTAARALAIQSEQPTAPIACAAWDDRHQAIAGHDVLINTTSLGMRGKEKLALQLQHVDRDALVVDIVYRPLQTDLLAAAAQQRLQTMDGLQMLVQQARLSFQHWFGILPDYDSVLHAKLIKELA